MILYLFLHLHSTQSIDVVDAGVFLRCGELSLAVLASVLQKVFW